MVLRAIHHTPKAQALNPRRARSFLPEGLGNFAPNRLRTEAYILQPCGVESRELSAIAQAPKPEKRRASRARYADIRRDTIKLVEPLVGTTDVAITRRLRFQCDFAMRNLTTPPCSVAEPAQLRKGHDRYRCIDPLHPEQ
jgi:hypothetical protein